MSTNEVLKAVKISKNFGGIQAVDNFSISLKKGEITGIIGPNGAGKTTIFNLISGICQIDEGKIFLEDKEITNMKQHKIARAGIARTFQNIRVFESLNVIENIFTALDPVYDYNFADSISIKKRRNIENEKHNIAEKLLKIVGLWKYKEKKPKNLAYGLQRKLEIARALALNPKVLLLDEPAAGLNPKEDSGLIDLIKNLMENYSFSIMIIEHRMEVILNLCKTICVQNFGETLAIGCPDEIVNNEKVIEAYLGEAE